MTRISRGATGAAGGSTGDAQLDKSMRQTPPNDREQPFFIQKQKHIILPLIYNTAVGAIITICDVLGMSEIAGILLALRHSLRGTIKNRLPIRETVNIKVHVHVERLETFQKHEGCPISHSRTQWRPLVEPRRMRDGSTPLHST